MSQSSLLSLRFLLFGLVGLSGVGVQIGILGLLYRLADWTYFPALVVSVLVAMVTNFLLNNWFTYADRRLHGLALLWGLVSFCAACTIGALVNIASAQVSYHAGVPWFMAGAIGAVAGAVFNFWSTGRMTWKDGA